jgi:hypothetical protein
MYIDILGSPGLIGANLSKLDPRFNLLSWFFLTLFPDHMFELWHRFSIDHTKFPYTPGPEEEPKHDVVRATPSVFNRRGRMTTRGSFDTALFIRDPTAFGIHSESSMHP